MAKVNLFTDPFAAVDIAPINIPGIESHNKISVRVKDDTGEYQLAGILGKDYNLIQNQIAHETALDIFSRSEHQMKNMKTFFDGKRYVDYFHSANPIVADEGLELHLGVMVRNSYDGSGKFALEIFALNPFCTNQYHQRNQFGFFEIRHTTNGSLHIDIDDAMKNLSLGAGNIIAAAPRIIAMRKQPLELEHIVNAVKSDIVPKTSWGEIIKGLEGATMFSLYQALTAYASHESTGLTSISYGNLIGEHFFPVQKAE